MKALTILFLAVPAFGNLMTQATCKITNNGQTTTYSDPSACPGGSVIVDPPLSFALDLAPLGFPGGQTDTVTLLLDFTDSFEVLNVSSGTIQWFGELDHVSFGGDEGVTGSWKLGGMDWPIAYNIPVVTPFVGTQQIDLAIHLTLGGSCCIHDADDAIWKFLLNSVKVFDANGNPVVAPVYESSSSYTYPVLGGVQAPEPGTWTLAALGLAVLYSKRHALKK
jgi:hypothetical protein